MSDEQKPQVPTRGKAPVFLNGRLSTHTYLCIGVRNGEDGHNAVGVRRLGQDHYKLHFWPNAAFFGVALSQANSYGMRRDGGQSHGGYEGSAGDFAHVEDILAQLAQKEGTSVAPLDKVLEVLAEGFKSNRHFTA